jgi:hypothetical protein
MATLIVSSFGVFVMGLFAGLFTTPSWQTFTVLAYGWAVAGGERQTITDLSVAHRGHDGEAFLVLLGVSGWRAVPSAVAAVGAAHPLCGAVGAR